ncbi:MAG TPA: hypothetical protein VK386_08940 [Acidimicrobiales bacterium]|nr:hypothetical protein [Acidimicrobiales bacterium]
MTTLSQWAADQLAFGDWPFTQEKLIGMVSWALAEGDIAVPRCSGALWNPLDTEEPAPGAVDFNAAGVKSYPTEQVGLEAVYATLHNGLHPGVLKVLEDEGSSAMSLAQAVGNDSWGTGNFSTVVERVKADPATYFAVEVPGSGDSPPVPLAPPEDAPMYYTPNNQLHAVVVVGNQVLHYWQQWTVQDGQVTGQGTWNVETLPQPS